MQKLLLALFAFGFLVVSAAHAEWMEASSDHFVVYGDLGTQSIGSFAERLELFDAAMTHVLKTAPAKPSPSNRLTVYVVSDPTTANRIAARGDLLGVGTFVPAAGASVVLVPQLEDAATLDDASPQALLFHGYAHQFLFRLTAHPFPRWFVEGFAQFFAGVKYTPGGSIQLGAEAPPRAREFAQSQPIPIRRLLAYDGGVSDSASFDALYGQSWLLFHYLYLAPERANQLARYQAILARGEPALRAAELAFGDLDQLQRDANRYLKRLRFNYLEVGRNAVPMGSIHIRRLRPGEAAMMPVVIQSKALVNRDEALALVPVARSVAEAHRDDPAALAALADVEFNAGDDDAAIAAADGAIALDPQRIDAQIQKGNALFRKAQNGSLPQDSWKEVRAQFASANKLEYDNPIPLIRFYLTYLEQGLVPPKNAVEGLEWALALSPLDPSVRQSVAQQYVADNRLADAAATLMPLAYSPHPDKDSASALRVLQDIEAKMAQPQAAPTH